MPGLGLIELEAWGRAPIGVRASLTQSAERNSTVPTGPSDFAGTVGHRRRAPLMAPVGRAEEAEPCGRRRLVCVGELSLTRTDLHGAVVRELLSGCVWRCLCRK
jgi:hypothetical protein